MSVGEALCADRDFPLHQDVGGEGALPIVVAFIADFRARVGSNIITTATHATAEIQHT